MSGPSPTDGRDDGDDSESHAIKADDLVPPRTISSDVLLGGHSQLAIRHNQTTYYLRQTRFGKLILTK